MSHDAFNAGVDLTGLHDVSSIKLLVCYITKKMGGYADKITVATALQQQGVANYFETLNAYSELIGKGLISEKDGVCRIEQGGEDVLRELESELPVSIKEKTPDFIKKVADDQRRKKENKVEITKQGSGVNIRCSVKQEDHNLIDLGLYMPGNEQACVIRDNFQKNASDIYNIVIAASIGDCEMLDYAVENYKTKLNGTDK